MLAQRKTNPKSEMTILILSVDCRTVGLLSVSDYGTVTDARREWIRVRSTDRVLMDLLHNGVNKAAGLRQFVNVAFHLFHRGIVSIDGGHVRLDLSNVLF